MYNGIAVICRITLALAMLCLVAACGSNSRSSAPPEPPPSQTPLVGKVRLDVQTAPSQALDIVVAVFDQGIDDPAERQQVFPTVRKAESLLLPVLLAETLADSGIWGAVRVSHSETVRVPLLLEGEIVRADGEELELAIRLRASDGTTLLARNYRDRAEPEDYPVAQGGEPFADLYRAISNDVSKLLITMSVERRRSLQRIALMRFGSDLAPSTFAKYLARDRRGTYELLSFPADDDPMLGRLARLRRQDELFIDAVDDEYTELRDRVEDSYALWREYSFELQRFGAEYRATASSRKSSARRGSFAAMQQSYASYRKVKIQEADLGQLVSGFAGESLETILEVDDGVFRLSGSVDQRYTEWRGILSRIYDLETGDL